MISIMFSYAIITTCNRLKNTTVLYYNLIISTASNVTLCKYIIFFFKREKAATKLYKVFN